MWRCEQRPPSLSRTRCHSLHPAQVGCGGRSAHLAVTSSARARDGRERTVTIATLPSRECAVSAMFVRARCAERERGRGRIEALKRDCVEDSRAAREPTGRSNRAETLRPPSCRREQCVHCAPDRETGRVAKRAGETTRNKRVAQRGERNERTVAGTEGGWRTKDWERRGESLHTRGARKGRSHRPSRTD